MKHSKLLILFIFGLFLSTTSIAQQVDRSSMDLTTGLQRALEVDSVADDLQKIVVLCANACEQTSTKVRKPVDDVIGITSRGVAASGMPTGKRDAASGMATGKRDAASGMATGKRDSASGMPTGRRDAASGMATGKRDAATYEQSTTTKAHHDTATATIQNIRALRCIGAENCVNMIARNNSCKAATVTCSTAGCSCEKM